jgi:hypothetical protein
MLILGMGRGDLKAMKKHSSQITGPNERKDEEGKIMTRSARGQKNDYESKMT